MADILPEQLVQRALNETKEAEDAHKKRIRRYDESYEVYRASGSKAKSQEPWQSQLRVPYGMQTVDTMVVNVVTGKPRGKVKPQNPAAELGAAAMQVALDNAIRKDKLVEKQPVLVQQAGIYGATVAKNHYLYREGTRLKRVFGEGPQGLYSHGEPETCVLFDGPTCEPWDLYDAWWDPNGRDVDSCAYFVLRSWLSKDQLLAGERTESNPSGVYDNVQELLKTGEGPKDYTSAQQRFLGTRGLMRKGRFEILEIWRNDTLTVVGNRRVLLRFEPNPFWHGGKPIVFGTLRPDLFQMQGVPETELLDHLQQALWTLMNMRMDNLHLTTMRGITYREGGVTDPDLLQLKPRFKWPVADHDDIKPFEIPPLPGEAYREDETLLSRMQLVTGITPYITGQDMPNLDQNTATGITALQEVATRLLRFKASQMQYKIYDRTFEQFGSMIQQFTDKPLTVRVDGPQGDYQWVTVSPEELSGDFEYSVEGTEESLSKQQERGEAIQLLNAFTPIVPTGIINLRAIVEKVCAAYGIDNPEQLLNPQTPQQPAAPVAPGQQMGQPPQPPQLGNGQPNLNPLIQQAIQGGGRIG